MKKFFTFLFFISFTSVSIFAQELAFKDDFKLEENDMDALIHQYKIDQNGNKMAIIKMVNPNKGFAFDIGSIGDALVEEKKGETWVYVPQNTKRITVNHESLGVLRNYEIPLEIEAGRVYSVTLISGTINKEIKEVFNKVFLSIESNPANAEVFFNKIALPKKTPFKNELYPPGSYSVKISKSLYYDFDTFIDIKPKENLKLFIHLKPKFGFLNIKTIPEINAHIEIDEFEKQETTPTILDKLKSGNHTIKVFKEYYEPITQDFNIKENETTSLQLTLKPLFGILKIYAKPAGAAIFINNTFIGFDSIYKQVNGNQETFVEIKKTDFKTISKNIFVNNNAIVIDSFTLIKPNGELLVTTDPDDAEIFIDSIKYENRTPTQISNLPIGKHQVAIKKIGFKPIYKEVEINETSMFPLKLNLESFKDALINIACINTTAVNIYANNTFIGTTPLKNKEFKKGTYTFRFEKTGFKSIQKSIEIKETEFYLSISLEEGEYTTAIPIKSNQTTQSNNPNIPTIVEQKNVYVEPRFQAVDFISKKPGAKVYYGNEFIGKTPFVYNLKPGYYPFVVTQENFRDFNGEIFISDTSTTYFLKQTPLPRVLFFGLKYGKTQANIDLPANATTPLSPYLSYTNFNNNIKVFTPADIQTDYFSANFEVFTSIKRYISFQIEGIYTSIGANYNNKPLEIKQIRIPLTFKWYFIRRVWALTFNYSTNIIQEVTYNGKDISNLFNKENISYGVGTELNLGRSFYIGGTYNVEQKPMLLNDQNPSSETAKHYPISINAFVGLRF